MDNLLLMKIFSENLNEAISLAEMDVFLNLMSISTNGIASFRFRWKILKNAKRHFHMKWSYLKEISDEVFVL